MKISNIITNSRELQSETRILCIPMTPWDERVFHLYDTKRVEDKKHFLLDFPGLTHICSNFQNLFHAANILDMLSQQNYSDLGMLLSFIFNHRNKMLKNHN